MTPPQECNECLQAIKDVNTEQILYITISSGTGGYPLVLLHLSPVSSCCAGIILGLLGQGPQVSFMPTMSWTIPYHCLHAIL